MEQSRVSAITNTFKTHLGRIPTSPELKTYLSAKGDVADLIKKTTEYRYRVKSVLDQVYRSLLGTACDDDECDKFISWCDSVSRAPAHECSRESMQEFVSLCTAFVDKYTGVVDQVYDIEIGKVPDIATKTRLAARFRDEKFTVQDLVVVIRDAEGPGVARDDIETAGDTTVFHKTVPKLRSELEFVEKWQRATGHRVDVYEFLRYYNELGSSPTPETIREVKEKQNNFFAHAVKVYRGYLNVSLDFHRFSAMHMHEYDNAGFVPKLIQTIVKGHEYRERMCDALSDAYTRTFDAGIHEEDLEHVFATVQKKSISIRSEDISGYVLKLGEELATIAKSVTAVYNRVLRRDPDDIEVRNCVASYRGSDTAEEDLETALYDELEYQEVLKSLIQEKTRSTKNSEVFRVMRHILKACDGNMRDAHTHIDSCVEEG
eukprot:jgi/Tetstr1/447271/TSEL_034708.t1